MQTMYFACILSFTSMRATVIASLRSEEVILKTIARGFVKQYSVVMEHVIVMEMIMPSFISMRAMYHWKV